jgi:hypothetical protein
LFNGARTSINVDGWFLTDSPDNLTKWRFPSTNIPPNGFLVVFASSKNRSVAGAPLHANFSLSADGEYLALVKPDGVTIAFEFDPFPNSLPTSPTALGRTCRSARSFPIGRRYECSFPPTALSA